MRERESFFKPVAEKVNAAAKKLVSSGEGFGQRKAFISDVAKAVGSTVARLGPMLIRFNQLGWIELARADMPVAMDPEKVSRSEIEHGNASWHLVVVPGQTSESRSALDGMFMTDGVGSHFTKRAVTEVRKRPPRMFKELLRISDKFIWVSNVLGRDPNVLVLTDERSLEDFLDHEENEDNGLNDKLIVKVESQLLRPIEVRSEAGLELVQIDFVEAFLPLCDKLGKKFDLQDSIDFDRIRFGYQFNPRYLRDLADAIDGGVIVYDGKQIERGDADPTGGPIPFLYDASMGENPKGPAKLLFYNVGDLMCWKILAYVSIDASGALKKIRSIPGGNESRHSFKDALDDIKTTAWALKQLGVKSWPEDAEILGKKTSEWKDMWSLRDLRDEFDQDGLAESIHRPDPWHIQLLERRRIAKWHS